MNKQGERKIQWCHYTWNPITGCLHNCSYCYVSRSKRFENDPMRPAFHKTRLKEKMPNEPSRIFVGSTGDMWGEWVSEKWIHRVLEVVETHPQHRYIFLTKHPIRYSDFSIPENAWCGTSFEGQDREGRISDLLISAPENRLFISLEPFTQTPDFLKQSCAEKLKWIIIGGLTGPKPRMPYPTRMRAVLNYARKRGIPVFIKHNARYPRNIEEYPAGLII